MDPTDRFRAVSSQPPSSLMGCEESLDQPHKSRLPASSVPPAAARSMSTEKINAPDLSMSFCGLAYSRKTSKRACPDSERQTHLAWTCKYLSTNNFLQEWRPWAYPRHGKNLSKSARKTCLLPRLHHRPAEGRRMARNSRIGTWCLLCSCGGNQAQEVLLDWPHPHTAGAPNPTHCNLSMRTNSAPCGVWISLGASLM